MKSEQNKETTLLSFLKNVRKNEIAFRQWLNKENKKSVLIAENEIRLRGAVSESARAVRHIRRLPAFADETPFLYRFAENFLKETKKELSATTLREALHKIKREN